MTTIVWFRNDLRVQDNMSLSRALASNAPVVAVYCFDPKHYEKDAWGFVKTQKYRAQFLIETISALRQNLEKLNIPLVVYLDLPEIVIPKLAKKLKATRLFCQKEWTTEERAVNEAVREKTKLEWTELYDQFLFHPDDIPFDTANDIPQVFTAFRKKCEKFALVRPCVSVQSAQKDNLMPQEPSQIPSLKDLGFENFVPDFRSAFPWSGGEDTAWQRLHSYFWDTKKLGYYKKTRNGLVGTDYSSKFSPWLANGSISARQIYWEVKRFEKEVKKNQDTYWLIFELIWRDYFKHISIKHKDAIFYQAGILDKQYDWHSNALALKNWISGNTPYDFVNANMLELRETGWMSNRGRQNVASYWAKELKQDWRIGAAYFESMLLDYDVHSNYGNWMYTAGVGNDPRDRKFNIKRQQEIYDSNGKFVKLWLQETLF